jgi:hypothetical protein
MTLTNWLKRLIFPVRRELSATSRKKFRDRWQEIEKLAKRNGEKDLRLAVLEADKLFSHILESLGFQGESWGQGVAQAKNRFSSSVFKGLWQARKIRNRIVHDCNHEFTSFESRGAFKKYRRAIKELGIIQP